MKISFFEEDVEERKEIIIALLVILFFGIMIYMMDWFSSKPKVIQFPQASNQNIVTDSTSYYQAETNPDTQPTSDNNASTQARNQDSLTDKNRNTPPTHQSNCQNNSNQSGNSDCPLDKNDSLNVVNKNQVQPNTVYAEEKVPLVSVDTDGDNTPDSDDLCPTVAGNNKGCPNDSDADGVPDDKDRCPNITGSLENHGCLPDTDGDKIPDSDDLCPTVAGSHKGCPADSDADGVPDDKDRCPNIAGSPKNYGCTIEKVGINNKDTHNINNTDKIKIKEVNVTEAERKIIANAISSVAFITGNSQLTQYSENLLDKVVSILIKNPNYNLLIRGHTDSQGDEKLNFLLSKSRAKSVFDYFTLKGISKNRMSHNGFGERKPIASNKTKKGRLKNRRVELKLFHAN